MNILITLEDLRTGGAQTFALRLAQALYTAGNTVTIYSSYAHYTNHDLARQLAPNVPIIAYGSDAPLLDALLRKADGLLRRLRLRISWREKQLVRHLRRTIKALRPHVVNSHTIKADYVAAQALEGFQIPLVITMHGCYELFLHKKDAPEVTPKGNYALQNAQGLVYLTDKNLEIFNTSGVRSSSTLPHVKIYNGFNGKISTGKDLRTRAVLGIPDKGFVFGMVARGIPEKGWAHAIHSFLELASDFPQLHLVLVGESEYLMGLQQQYPHPRIHFTGFAPNPIDWVDIFDVGLLPSYFHAESLPNSVTEYLFCSKPVIASHIGEVPAMLESSEGLAGVLLDQTNGQLTEPNQLTKAMRSYLTEPTLLARHQSNAELAFRKFDMVQCVQAYTELYSSLLG